MNNEKGFTLIELLVVVAIIGILAAIAIPQFSQYRQRGFDARAKTDLHNVATAEEAYFATNEVYKSCANTTCSATLAGVSSLSSGVALQITATTSGFTGTSRHPRGTNVTCRWNSSTGGFTACS